jgi:glutaredoxin 3
MSQAPITIYTTAWCGYCQRAKRLLQEKNLAFTEIDVENTPGMREEMMTRSGRRTVPQVFIGTRHVGGCDDLHALDRSGELEKLTSGG